jgi:hypothetical protein
MYMPCPERGSIQLVLHRRQHLEQPRDRVLGGLGLAGVGEQALAEDPFYQLDMGVLGED